MAQERTQPCLFDQASLLSKLTFWWLNPLLGRNPAYVAQTCSQYDVPAADEADLLERQLDGWWKREVRKYSDGSEASLLKAILSAFLLSWIMPGGVLLLAETARVVQPVLLDWLLGYITRDSTLTETSAYLYGFGLGCMLALHTLLLVLYTFLMHRAALKMKTALEALVFRKVMLLSSEAALQTSCDMVIQQLSTNMDVFAKALQHLHHLWVGPLQVAVVLYLLHAAVGMTGLLCVVVVAVAVILQAVLEPVVTQLREQSGEWVEQRQQITRRILAAMLQVKVFCLEMTLKPFMTSLRSKEMPYLRCSAVLQGILCCLLGLTNRLMLLVVVSVATSQELSLQSMFTTLALLDVLMWCLHQFPVHGVHDLLVLHAALRGVQTFLLLDEEKEQIKDLRLHRTVSYRNEPYTDWVVDIDHMTARWRTVHTGERKRFQKRRARDSTSSTKSLLHESDVEHAFSLKYLSLQVKKGELLALIGAAHSGKTSLLMTLMGELPYEIGQISVNGRVSYCSQRPWLFSASVRENITFGDTFDAIRYDKVVRSCCLVKLLEALPEGDETEVGERGLQLSTGYAARITLARAVYNNADIYLLDDIMGLVDNSTKQDLFRGCVGGMLQGRTRIMVTQNWQCLRSADRIAVLREGSLYDIGSLEELQARGVDVREFVVSDTSKHPAQLESEEELFHVRLEMVSPASHAHETKGRKIIGPQSDKCTFFTFLTGTRAWVLWPLTLLLWLGSQALMSAADWMLACWIVEDVATLLPLSTPVTYVYQPTSSASPNPPLISLNIDVRDASFLTWFDLYILLLASGIGMSLLSVVGATQLCVTAGQALHNKMVSVMMRAEANFFILTPTDGIVSVFTQHLKFIDTGIPHFTYLSTEMLLRIVAMVVVMCVVSPWLVLAVVVFIAVMAIVQVIGSRTMWGVYSFRESARVPVYMDIAETLSGLQTIRALRRHDHFLQGFDSHLNSLTWAHFVGLCMFSRLALTGMLVAVIFSSVIIYVSIALAGGVHGGLLGLVMTYCLTFSLPLHALLQHSFALANQMAAVDGALSLAQQNQEPAWFSDKPPPSDWPNRGSITFSRTSLLTCPDGPFIIRDMDVHIKSKEKVGVVGEAGSGKYSLMALMLRLQHVQGMIFIDGFDVLKIGLHELRKNISVVPQDPMLCPGMLRHSLDPEGAYSDEVLWAALDRVGLRERVSGIHGGLSADIDSDMVTFSLGQRQLVCLAHAALKNTKIILFEEVVDTSEQGLTDHIQRILRAKFRDCTVLMVASRLTSVMDCDRVMVFHRGEVKEFDTPYALLQQPSGHFTRLVEQRGEHQSQQLRSMAELSHQQRASTSLMLEHAVFMATEQLRASTEDLTFRPGSLAWSHIAKFSESQDSLEKAHSDRGGQGGPQGDEDVGRAGIPLSKGRAPPSLAPAQKIIHRRRMSPGRGKRHGGGGAEDEKDKQGEGSRTGGEQMPLLSYDAPPRSAAHQHAGKERRSDLVDGNRRHNHPDSRAEGGSGNRMNDQPETGPLLDYKSSPKPGVPSLSGQRSPAGVGFDTSGRRSAGRRVLETAIDAPLSGFSSFSPYPHSSDSSASSPTALQAASSDRGNNQDVPRGHFVSSRERRARLISGEYSAPEGSKEDTEKIIYC